MKRYLIFLLLIISTLTLSACSSCATGRKNNYGSQSSLIENSSYSSENSVESEMGNSTSATTSTSVDNGSSTIINSSSSKSSSSSSKSSSSRMPLDSFETTLLPR